MSNESVPSASGRPTRDPGGPTAGSDRLPNRWFIVIAAIFMQLSLGAVYGWSVFVLPFMNEYDWTRSQVTLAFTLAIFFLGVGTIIGGLLQDKYGPRLVATIAGVLYGAAYILTGTANSLGELYLWYGFVSGIGMGMGYITPVATLLKWFPDKRGLITGLAVAGYGAAALIMSPWAANSIEVRGISSTFYILGVIYLVVVIAAAQFYKVPPEGYSPPGWQASAKQMADRALSDYTVRQATATWQFWALFAILFLNVSAGIMIISQASPMGQEIVGMSEVTAAGLVVGVISIFNGAGRVFWAWLSDMMGRKRVFLTMFLIQAVLFFLLPNLTVTALFVPAVAIIALCYGGGFGTMPSFTADYFGTKFVGGIYGIILLAWGLAAIPSPLLIAYVRETTGTYTTAIYILAAVMLVSVVLPFIMRPPRRRETEPVGDVMTEPRT